MLLGTVNAVLITVAAAILFYNFSLPDTIYVSDINKPALPEFVSADFGEKAEAIAVSAQNVTTARADLKLFGAIPLKEVTVQSLGTPAVVPLGTPFGIKMLTDGVLVVDTSGFPTKGGYSSPAAKAGIKPGDVIKTIDEIPVYSNADVSAIMQYAEDGADIVYVRGGKESETSLIPEKSNKDGKLKAGMWVKDSSAGIGTLTFADPITGIAAGLGHPVCDTQTGEILPLFSGQSCEVSITHYRKGTPGEPGELTASFAQDTEIGELLGNRQNGIYTEINVREIDEMQNRAGTDAIPLAFRDEVKKGEAVIYSTIEGDTPQTYTVSVEEINRGGTNDSKDMIIKITDERLLESTGGIIQGMSGSPIIQNGKVIGAVTHVFVNNPAKGYAIFADTMYAEQMEIYKNGGEN
ncbi:MAG: SpoIVB peptidase [Ruminococcus sp.]|jgi:stage IV sporulation protein B|nr:SpoIVB peptidase [Ruminococcus sp.]